MSAEQKQAEQKQETANAAVATAVRPELVRQAHGGALYAGGVRGNRGSLKRRILKRLAGKVGPDVEAYLQSVLRDATAGRDPSMAGMPAVHWYGQHVVGDPDAAIKAAAKAAQSQKAPVQVNTIQASYVKAGEREDIVQIGGEAAT